MIDLNTKEWNKKFKKFLKMIKKDKTQFIGFGMMPVGKHGINFEIWNLLNELMDENEDFTEWVRIEIFGLEDEKK